MIKDILESFLTPPENDFLGWTIFVLLWVLILALFCFILWGILWALNYWFRPTVEGVATIVGTHFEPSHYTTTIIMSGKVAIPTTVYHPNAWSFKLQINGCEDNFYVSKEIYVKYHVGDIVKVRYTTGRIWNSINIRNAFL